jgi:hypothetical protein
MKRGLTLLAAAGILLGMSFQAQATPISISPGTAGCAGATSPCLALTGITTSQSDINAAIEAMFPGLTGTAIYKQDEGGSEEGSAAPWYTTSFTGDLSGGTITWVPGSSYIGGTPIYLLVKDGNHTPAWYLYDISGWDGQSLVELSGFWPGPGGISHVTIYGGGVPDGGSAAMLLGAALIGLAGFRRMLK